MNKDQKAAVVDEIAEQLQGAEAIFAVDYRGISVPDAAELRTKLRDADATFRVVKNRLTIRAAEKAGTAGLDELLEGPTALTFVRGDAALAAKALNDFARGANILEFKGALLEGQALTVDEIKSIARLPAREVLHAQLVGTIAAPVTGLVRGLNQLIAGIASQLQQMADQGLVSGEAPAEPAAEAETAPAEEPAAETQEAPAEEAAAAEAETPAEEEEAAETEEAPAAEADATETENEEANASADADDQDAAEA